MCGIKGYGFVEFENPESMDDAIKTMDRYDLGGKAMRVGACVTPPSLQNITTSSHRDIKDEDKLKPARMLSEQIKRAEAAAANGSEMPAIEFEQPKAPGQTTKGSAANDKVSRK